LRLAGGIDFRPSEHPSILDGLPTQVGGTHIDDTSTWVSTDGQRWGTFHDPKRGVELGSLKALQEDCFFAFDLL